MEADAVDRIRDEPDNLDNLDNLEDVDNPVVDYPYHYICPYDTKQQLWRILDVAKLHNEHLANPGECPVDYVRYSEHEPYTLLEPGKELVEAELVTFKERWAPYQCPSLGPSLSRGVCFSNAGDHLKTFAFLQWHLLRALPNVYVNGFPAITAYQCDAYTFSQIASWKVVNPERIRGERSENALEVMPVNYYTRATRPNPDFADLMAGLEEGESRAKRMRLNPHVPPYQAVIHASLRPWPTSSGEAPSPTADTADNDGADSDGAATDDARDDDGVDPCPPPGLVH